MAILLNCLTPLGTLIFNSFGNLISNSFGLDEKMRNLERRILQLRCQENDINQQLGSRQRREVLDNWLENVRTTIIEFETLQQAIGETRFYSFSRVQLGKRVESLIEKVGELCQEDNFSEGLSFDVHETRGIALPTTGVVGQTFSRNCEEVLRCLMNDEVLSMGIYGMGGVGKTAVMKHVHNQMLEDRDTFGSVYWVTVSHNFSIDRLQNDISGNVGLDLSKEGDEIRRAACLSEALKRKGKYVLILDEVWDNIPLVRVGIPVGVNQCKLILTTRSLEMCNRMGCQRKLKLSPLSKEEAWELFMEKLGPDGELTSNVIETAKRVAQSCAGLPLGIITMAAIMKGVSDIHEWRNVLEEVNNLTMWPNCDMESEVFRTLEYNYNHLGNKKLQLCLIHCALYLKDEKIPRDELIVSLIDEGLIEKGESRQAEIDMGHTVLNKLEKRCFLESSLDYDERKCVKMHDLIRDMALQIQINQQDVVVGFDEESTTLLDQLTGRSQKLQLISIVGMPGLGKTSLARKLYTHPLIVYTFDIRAWTSVSQVYVRRDLLLGILTSISEVTTSEIDSISDHKLGEMIYKRFKRQRYLLVLDDIWGNRAWDDLKIYIPDDKVGSRIVLTSRDVDLSSDVQATQTHTHSLRLRTETESWDIFRNKVFLRGICPRRLEEVGREITRKCYGLPLSIVITAGLLQNKWAQTSWLQVAESLNSYIVSDPNQYMDRLAFSYDDLPPHLTPCFLYLGTFPEDCQIPVQKLTWLWVAEGFVHDQTAGRKSLEEIAQDYFMDLLRRSLVMVAKKGSDGGIKACRIHDLLRDLCLRKAEEVNFSPLINRFGPISPNFSSSASSDKNLDQLLTRLYEHSAQSVCLKSCISVKRTLRICDTYKFLWVLDVESISIPLFPNELTLLIGLRYLAIKVEDGNPPPSISNLLNLQMLIISSRRNIVVPRTTWKMVNLRHLHIKSGENLIEEPPIFVGYPGVLENLQTMSQLYPSLSFQQIFSRTPNLRKLGFCGPLISSSGDLEFPNLGSLGCLQTLKLLNTTSYPKAAKLCNPDMFPERLKRLTLSNLGLGWAELRTLALLPNLVILKLKSHACTGQVWETSDVEFPELKFLKLQDLDIVRWKASSDHFPKLQRLVAHQCQKLEEIPLGLGDILTLELIEVSWCSEGLAQSAREIQEEQESKGNDFLKVLTTMHIDLTRNTKGSREVAGIDSLHYGLTADS